MWGRSTGTKFRFTTDRIPTATPKLVHGRLSQALLCPFGMFSPVPKLRVGFLSKFAAARHGCVPFRATLHGAHHQQKHHTRDLQGQVPLDLCTCHTVSPIVACAPVLGSLAECNGDVRVTLACEKLESRRVAACRIVHLCKSMETCSQNYAASEVHEQSLFLFVHSNYSSGLHFPSLLRALHSIK